MGAPPPLPRRKDAECPPEAQPPAGQPVAPDTTPSLALPILFSFQPTGPIARGGNWLHYSIWRVPMSQKPNPFLRGYWNLKIVRTLSISYEDGSPHVWRNIHASQEHLSDEELVSSSCIVTNDFAVVCNGPEGVSAEVLAEIGRAHV